MTLAVLIPIIIVIVGIHFIVRDYIFLDNTTAFSKVFEDIEKEYVLVDHKSLNLNEIQNRHEVQFENAKDVADVYIAWLDTFYDFHDGHAQTVPTIRKDQITDAARERLAGNDYGLSMITLDSGQTVAIMVEKDSEASKLGIETGTVITKWNGVTIDEAKKDIRCVYSGLFPFPVKENETKFQTFFLAGKGGDTVLVSYLDKEGNEHTNTLWSIGSYKTRLNDVLKLYLHSNDLQNLYWEIQDDKYGYLCLNAETDGLISGITGKYTHCQRQIEKMISEMEEQGINKLVIDMRNNTGGDDRMAMTVLSYFTDEKFFYYADGEKDGDEYKTTKEYEFEGNGMASDFSIVMIVNAQTISAADGLAFRASSLPQVTLVGMTTSNNSYQAVGGDALIKGGIYVGYPHILQLNENSEVMIDPDEKGEASVSLDERAPVTSESVIELFDNKEDIELNFAKELLAH